MRPTGQLHLGHYHGVLKNWVRLQHEYECFFFVADWHALTTDYEQPQKIEQAAWDMVIDWLAAGVNPGSATMFIQSRVPEHAELHLLLSMMTPLGWLERVPTYKDQQEKLKEKDGSRDAELRDVFEVMKMSEEKKMGRVKREVVCLRKSVELWKRYVWWMCLW